MCILVFEIFFIVILGDCFLVVIFLGGFIGGGIFFGGILGCCNFWFCWWYCCCCCIEDFLGREICFGFCVRIFLFFDFWLEVFIFFDRLVFGGIGGGNLIEFFFFGGSKGAWIFLLIRLLFDSEFLIIGVLLLKFMRGFCCLFFVLGLWIVNFIFGVILFFLFVNFKLSFFFSFWVYIKNCFWWYGNIIFILLSVFLLRV